MKKVIQFILNNQAVCIETDPAGRLLDTIRDLLGYKGTKEGCGIGECGACTVIMDGRTVNSCVTLKAQAEGRMLTTIEGLAGDKMADVIKKAYVEELEKKLMEMLQYCSGFEYEKLEEIIRTL